MLAYSLAPAVLNSLSEEFREVIHVLGSHEMGLVSFWLQPLLRGIWRGDRAQVHGANLCSASNALEYPVATLLRLTFSIHLYLDNISGGICDNHTKRVRKTS